MQLYHFAGSETIVGSVVDNAIVNPYVGAQFEAFFDFDIKLHGILTVQRDRAVEDESHTPGGGLLQFRMSKWGVYIDEQIYAGGNLMPYYYSAPNRLFANGYGADSTQVARSSVHAHTGRGMEVQTHFLTHA